MTAIALLNVENDPHIFADTLLTADGQDASSHKFVWLPSVGCIKSEYGTPEKPWHIARLGRKSFFLPNYGGVIAFAGHCKSAFDFWSELSASIMNNACFNPSVQVHSGMIIQALERVDNQKFSLLGLIKNEKGFWEVFTHNNHKRLNTLSFGTCYLAGTGADMLEEQIGSRDKHVRLTKRPNVIERISSTENLAEGLSADLLYHESDYSHGFESTVKAYSSGGFYEWYGLGEGGVKMMPARLDIHIKQVDGSPEITRLYFIEVLQQSESTVEPIPTQKYNIHVMNIGLEPMKPLVGSDGSWFVSISDVYGVCIESTFTLYDSQGRTGRLSGSVTEQILTKFFGKAFGINRIRLICSGDGQAVSSSISRQNGEPDVLSTLIFKDKKLAVSIGHAVSEKADQLLRDLKKRQPQTA